MVDIRVVDLTPGKEVITCKRRTVCTSALIPIEFPIKL